MIKEIEAKVILNYVKQPDNWFGLKYSMNLYRGCQHQCIYCDSRSECYGIDTFNTDVLFKGNAIDLLRSELARKRKKGTIGTGSMNDPYMPLEKKLKLTRRALETLAEFQFPVHIVTKSDLVTRDLDLLVDISRTYTAVSFTITTADDELGKKLEPGAPSVSDRFRAMKQLSAKGILTGVMMMPILPFIEDSEENIAQIITKAHQSGASYFVHYFGMTMRNRQRVYYYEKLDRLFPGIRERYEKTFGEQYSCHVTNAGKLELMFRDLCERFGISTHLIPYTQKTAKQLNLF